jgi:DNA-binding SARP family transcriptional activator
LQARRGNTVIDLGPVKQQAVFALLALRVGRPVSYDELEAAVWGASAPVTARQIMHTYVARLRQRLEPEKPPRGRVGVIAPAPFGYRLVLDPGRIDMVRFRELATAARVRYADGDPAGALATLGEAMRLWRDPMLTELSRLLNHSHEIESLRQYWTEAALAYVTLGVELNADAAVRSTAERLAGLNPLHERIQAQYLTILARGGHRVVALDRLAEIRTRLVEELGVQPGPELNLVLRRLVDPAWNGVGDAAAPRPADWWWRSPATAW